MIESKDFEQMRKELAQQEEEREEVIQKSRDVIKISKQIIYALHRGDIKQAGTLKRSISSKVRSLQAKDSSVGIKDTAYQEYVEALAYLHFIKEGRLITREECGVETEQYLMGLCDLTGELMRKAVNEVIQKNTGGVYIIYELISGLYEEFLKFELRNSELRKKSDAIKWNLNKVEDIIYNLELRDTDASD